MCFLSSLLNWFFVSSVHLNCGGRLLHSCTASISKVLLLSDIFPWWEIRGAWPSLGLVCGVILNILFTQFELAPSSADFVRLSIEVATSWFTFRHPRVCMRSCLCVLFNHICHVFFSITLAALVWHFCSLFMLHLDVDPHTGAP